MQIRFELTDVRIKKRWGLPEYIIRACILNCNEELRRELQSSNVYLVHDKWDGTNDAYLVDWKGDLAKLPVYNEDGMVVDGREKRCETCGNLSPFGLAECKYVFPLRDCVMRGFSEWRAKGE